MITIHKSLIQIIEEDKMYIPPCPECQSINSLIYNIITDDWVCKNCGYIAYGGYFDDEE